MFNLSYKIGLNRLKYLLVVEELFKNQIIKFLIYTNKKFGLFVK